MALYTILHHPTYAYQCALPVSLLSAIHFRGYVQFQDGYTPLHLAVDKGHSEVVSLLLAGGADIEATSKVMGLREECCIARREAENG